MTLREAVYNALSGDSDLTGIVGTRIYWMLMPQGVIYPAVTFEMLPASARVSLMGVDSTLAMDTVQVTVWGEAEHVDDMETAAGYIQAVLQDFTGTLGGGGGVSIDRIFLESNQQALLNAEVGVYQIAQEFVVWYQED